MIDSMMSRSIRLGALIGAGFGGMIGAIMAAWSGSLIGLPIGLVLGALTGTFSAALTVKTAGATGGIGVGYFTGVIFGALFGVILGMLIPASWWMNLPGGLPFSGGMVMSRFEGVIHISFLCAILATVVGVWVGGRNVVPVEIGARRKESIDQYDLVEIIRVPEELQGVIDVGDIGVVVEIDDNQHFEIECILPDGSYKWLQTLHRQYVRLKHKIPDNM